MAESKLLKEAIADAKTVRKTAIENARIALEEAFTPKLQSLLSKKIQAEMEEDEWEEEDDIEESLDSSDIGAGSGNSESGTSGKEPTANVKNAHTELDPETDDEKAPADSDFNQGTVVDDLTETEADGEPTHEDDPFDAEYDVNEEEEDDIDVDVNDDEEEMEFDDDEDLDLESIIRELESELDDEESDEEESDEEEVDFDALGEDDEIELDLDDDEESSDDEEEVDFDSLGEEDDMESDEDEMEFDDEIDLDEILREMGFGDEDDEEEAEEDNSELEADLEQAYETIRSLKSTINEVNLLNAKLLYTNKLFRSYDLDNSQKVKVVESLDRTHSVREVKLVYATLAESMRFSGGVKSKKVRKITEGFASKKTASTKPSVSKDIITENTDDLANRFKQLAGINK